MVSLLTEAEHQLFSHDEEEAVGCLGELVIVQCEAYNGGKDIYSSAIFDLHFMYTFTP